MLSGSRADSDWVVSVSYLEGGETRGKQNEVAFIHITQVVLLYSGLVFVFFFFHLSIVDTLLSLLSFGSTT